MAWESAASIINDVLLELALVGAEVANPYTSGDSTIVQMRRMLKTAGRYLTRQHGWSHLRKTYAFTTTSGQAAYPFPADFLRLVDQTQWNRTEQMPLAGPVSPQGWQLLKGVLSTGVVNYYHRVSGNALELHPTPTESNSVVYEYQSSAWVQPIAETSPTQDEPASGGDLLWFDSHLLSRLLKLRWLEARGFPTTAALSDYQEAFNAATSSDGAAPVLRLDVQPLSLWRPLDGANVPFTGFGE